MATDPLPNVGNDLLRIHKVITRGLKVSLQNSQDPTLPENHQEGFRTYVRALTILLHSHHAGEDELAFPFWRIRLPDGPFDHLINHHRQMGTYLAQIELWLGAGSTAWQSDARRQLNQALTGLLNLWQTHIALEEATIGPENCSKNLTPAENELLGRQLAEHGQAHSQPGEIVMPFVIYNLSGTEREWFVKMLPPVMLQQLIPIAWKAAWSPMIPFLLAE
jgi:hypothetical protein